MPTTLGVTLGLVAITIIVASGASVGGGYGTGTTSASGSTGTTGASSTGTPAPATIVHMQEASGTTAYDGESSHRLRITFQIPGSTSTTGTMGSATSTSTASTTGTTGTSSETTGSTTTGSSGLDESAAVVSQPAGLATSWHEGHRLNAATPEPSAAQPSPRDTTTLCSTAYGLAVDTASVDALTNDTTTSFTSFSSSITDPSGTNGGTFSITDVGAHPGDKVTLHMDAAGRTIHVFTICVQVVFDSTTNELWQYTYCWHTGYVITKTTATGVSVDTRKTYGQPDKAGELPGDANAPPNYINFSGWLFGGGLFAGNADFGTGDLSGTSRMQLYATLPSATDIVFETATVVNLGPSAAFSTSANLTGYMIPSTDTNASVASSAVTWATAWNIGGGHASLAALDFSSYPAPEYANFEFSTYSTTATGMISIASTNESTVVSTPTSFWQYFADATYLSALGSETLPLSDGQPRVWTADQIFQNTWTNTVDEGSATGCPS